MLTLLGLQSFWDCLAHLEVFKGFSKRGPNKQGLERTLQSTQVRQHDGLSVLMVGSSLSLPLIMMKGDFFDVEKKFYLVVAEMFSLW